VAKRATRAEGLERVRSWKATGKSRAEFAAKEDYSERSLGWWAWKLSSEGEALDAKPRKVRRRSVKRPKSIEHSGEPIGVMAGTSRSPNACWHTSSPRAPGLWG